MNVRAGIRPRGITREYNLVTGRVPCILMMEAANDGPLVLNRSALRLSQKRKCHSGLTAVELMTC
jgi:hypothetical protein